MSYGVQEGDWVWKGGWGLKGLGVSEGIRGSLRVIEAKSCNTAVVSFFFCKWSGMGLGGPRGTLDNCLCVWI